MATNLGSKSTKSAFIRRSRIPKWIRVSQFRFQKVQWQLFLYTVYKFGEILSSNPGVNQGERRTVPRRSAVELLARRSIERRAIGIEHSS